MTRNHSLVALVLALSLIAAACGSSEPETSTAADAETTTAGATATEGAASEADIAFAQGMIPHHSQAVVMAALAADRSTDPAILDLASRIQGAQQPEIEMMRSWLDDWGSSEMADDMAGMDHSMMEGMMTDEELGELESMTGPDFDAMFVEMMIAHHEGAISMAETVLADGTNPDARALAEAIIAAQQAEIDEMNAFQPAS